MFNQVSRGLVVALTLGVGGCNWWRAEPAPRARVPDFPPPLDASINGPLIWAEAYPRWGRAPLTVHFDVQPVEPIRPAAWAWSFGDGSPIVHRRRPVHVYRQAGIYEARAWVRDLEGRVGMDVVTIRVE